MHIFLEFQTKLIRIEIYILIFVVFFWGFICYYIYPKLIYLFVYFILFPSNDYLNRLMIDVDEMLAALNEIYSSE